VSAVGSDVTRVAVGDKVLLTPTPSCGRCYWCQRDQASLCVEMAGIMTNTFLDGSTGLSRGGEVVYRGLNVGGFAEQALATENGVVKLDGDAALEIVSVLGCSVQTGVGSVFNLARVEPGSTVLVMGLGGIGISIVQGARIAGARTIIVSDPVAERRDQAVPFGATHAIDPTTEDVVAECMRLTGDIGVDYAFDAVGSGALLDTGIYASRNGGTVMAIGAGPLDSLITVPPPVIVMSQKTIKGSVLGGVNSQRDVPMLIDLYRSGQLDLEAMITDRRPIEEINEAVDDMAAHRGLRTLLEL
jgi:Zn-dependent alcohol dehydrogenase